MVIVDFINDHLHGLVPYTQVKQKKQDINSIEDITKKCFEINCSDLSLGLVTKIKVKIKKEVETKSNIK
jgi:hypothetical protein